jgi:hypothetical protein
LRTHHLFKYFVVLALIVGSCRDSGPAIPTSDDGTEKNGSTWYAEGVSSFLNRMGREGEDRYDVGLRFHLENLDPGDTIAHARLRLASFGGNITSSADLLIEGVLQANPTRFSDQERPSQKNPKTKNQVRWRIENNWDEGNESVPLYYSSPNVAPIVNEILALPGWGAKGHERTMILCVRDVSDSKENNYVTFCDYSFGGEGKRSPAKLEIHKTVYDTFMGKEFLGRVTDRSATVNLFSLIETDVCVEYGTSPGTYAYRTVCLQGHPAQKALEITLKDLVPDKRYYYRLLYRKAGDQSFKEGEERSFHTQRPNGASFVFTVQSDEHLHNWYRLPRKDHKLKLYRITLENMAQAKPDFSISMGDFANTEFYTGRHAKNYQEALERYLLQRTYLDRIAHSIPYYLVIGNHEGENGWYYTSEDKDLRDLSIFSTRARKEIMPNPHPNGFYTGNTEEIPEYGLREDYFAWEWGDALFVVLDPFWYTLRNARHEGKQRLSAEASGRYEGWDWTLGKRQYDWLYETLHGSRAKWKFVFIHHLTSTTVPSNPKESPFYGRGGIEVVKFKKDGRPSFEWGGENRKGKYVFESRRPGWAYGAIHDMLVKEKVTILFHGHDHFFAKQDLDGVVYQLCPQPVNAKSYGYREMGKYRYGDFLPSSGHLQVKVSPYSVRVEYVRSWRPGEGENGEIAFSYAIP